MNPFAVIFAICCLATAQARPGYSGDSHQLHAVPSIEHYGKIHYGKFDIIPLGSAIKNNLPPAVVTITKQVVHKVPQPYPVKVPVPHPVPVPVAKPYPVVETKIIKVPQPFPVEVIKKIPVPYEVPKPYPVHHEESGSEGGSFGGSFSGHEQLGGGGGEGGHEGGFGGGFEGGNHAGGYAVADQSGAYDTQVQSQSQQAGWVPVEMQHGEQQQQAEEQH